MASKRSAQQPTTLYDALFARDVAAARARIAAGDDPRSVHSSGQPLLHSAAWSLVDDDTSVALVELMLDHGADPNVSGEFWGPAIFPWAYAGLDRCVRVLVERGAAIDRIDGSDQHSLLQCAAAGGLPWLVVRCLAAAQDPNHLSAQGHSALQYAFDLRGPRAHASKDWRTIAESLVEAGANVHHMGKGDWGSVLHWAASRAPAEAVRWVLTRGVAIDVRTAAAQETPLHQAAWWGAPESVAALLDAGADLHAVDATGWTPLHFAALAHAPDNATLLRSRGARVDVRSTDAHRAMSTRFATKKTPRDVAARNKNPAVRAALE